MENIGSPALAEALERLWNQFLPQIQERVATLESAATAFAVGHLTLTEQQAAASTAHKLAGVLGSFGLPQGTSLARQLEVQYSRENGPDPTFAAGLAAIAAQLRTLIQTRK